MLVFDNMMIDLNLELKKKLLNYRDVTSARNYKQRHELKRHKDEKYQAR